MGPQRSREPSHSDTLPETLTAAIGSELKIQSTYDGLVNRYTGPWQR